MAFNKDELTAPSWMDNEFFVKVLSHCEDAGKLNVIMLDLCTVKFEPGG
jgi:hypothetical protein